MGSFVTKKGGARLGPSGQFELYLGGGQGAPRALCADEAFFHFVKEHWDFLMSPESERQIGQNLVYKGRTSTGKATVIFPVVCGKVKLIKGDGEFATFIWELPFAGAPEAGDEQQNASYSDAYDEGMGDPDAEFSSSEDVYYGEGGG